MLVELSAPVLLSPAQSPFVVLAGLVAGAVVAVVIVVYYVK